MARSGPSAVEISLTDAERVRPVGRSADIYAEMRQFIDEHDWLTVIQ
ncbi:hypothetical protein ABZ297_40800 [Nonomuraea sp. NPDC005983]